MPIKNRRVYCKLSGKNASVGRILFYHFIFEHWIHGGMSPKVDACT